MKRRNVEWHTIVFRKFYILLNVKDSGKVWVLEEARSVVRMFQPFGPKTGEK